jgi:hypothetical protein
MTELSALVIANARRWATGASLEVDGPNDGPEIREWLLRRGIDRPASWCGASACAWIEDAAAALRITLRLRRSAGALRLLELNPDLIIPIAEPGCLLIEDHGKGKGHVRIVTDVSLLPVSLDAISGNTSADGHSSNGDRVAERVVGLPSPLLAGYIRVG